MVDLPALRVIMMGTGDFAVPSFRRLLDHGPRLVALVTQPDRPEGRRRELRPRAIKQLALDRGVEVYQPEDVNAPEAIATIRRWDPDLAVVADYGQILAPALLAVPRLGGINVHGSLLPKYRGAAPVAWAIYHGEARTGVTIIQMSPRIDAGGILIQRSLAIDSAETAGELEARLAELGAEALQEAIEGLAAGTLAPVPQPPGKATRAPRLKKEDGRIDWARPARPICDQVRALQPWPQADTDWLRPGRPPVRLIIQRAHPVDQAGEEPPGTVVRADAAALVVRAGQGQAVQIDTLQPAGKRSMTAAEFVRGQRVAPGDRFGRGEAAG